MAFANGAGTRIAFVPEVTYDTTPSNPTFVRTRVTRGGMRTNKITAVSDELQPDRMIRDEMLLGKDSSGPYEAELSYGTFDTILEGLLFGAWSTDVLKNGILPKSFTIEETMELGTTDSFKRFTGAMVNQGTIDLTARQAARFSFDMMARRETLATAALSGATYTAPNTKGVMTASGSVASLDVASLSPAPKVRSLSLQINNNLRVRPVVGSYFSEEFGYGRCDVTGSINAYFESNALYDAVLDHGGGELSFVLGTVTGEKYLIELPNIVFLNGEVVTGGNDQDIMVNIPFRALYDAGESACIKITRAVA